MRKIGGTLLGIGLAILIGWGLYGLFALAFPELPLAVKIGAAAAVIGLIILLASLVREIDPLTYRGIRFFQAGFGSSGAPTKLVMEASWPGGERKAQTFTLLPGEAVKLGDSGVQVELGDFVPDFVLQGDQLSTRSNDPNNPAIRLVLTQPDGKRSSVWFFPKFPQMNFPSGLGITFQLRDVEMGYTTGLQVAKQPGKGLIWGGCLLLTAGLILALYMVHIRIWGVVGRDAKGRPILLLGGQPSKYRESFEARFNGLADAVEQSLRAPAGAAPELEHISA